MGEKKVPRVRESFFFWRWGPPNVIHTDRVLTELSQVHMASVESYVWLLGKKQQVCVFIFFLFPDGNNRLKTSQRWRRKEEGGLSIVFLGWQRIKHLYSIIKVCDHKIIKWNQLFIVWCLKSHFFFFFWSNCCTVIVAKGTFTQHSLCVYFKINIFR